MSNIASQYWLPACFKFSNHTFACYKRASLTHFLLPSVCYNSSYSTARAEPNCESRARGLALASRGASPRQFTRASAHALVDSHSHTASKTSRVKTRVLALETSRTYPYKGVGSVWLYPAQLALLVTPKTRATKLPCSPEGQVQCVTNLGEKHCLWAWHNYYASSVKNFYTCQFFACCSSR